MLPLILHFEWSYREEIPHFDNGKCDDKSSEQITDV